MTQPHSFTLEQPPASFKDENRLNAMTVDVEEHFQVQALQNQYDRGDWDETPSRVYDNTLRILDLFAEHGAKATFFILGWVAERHPTLMQKIVSAGHEIASHGLDHTRADTQTPEQFREDIRRTKKVLEDTSGTSVIGYRAATFSIGANNLWAYDILEEEGFLYSSSINPVKHDNYGSLDAPRFSFRPSKSGKIIEHPIPTLSLMGQNVPCGGGGYFRLLPYPYFRHAVKTINNTEGWPFMFYFHPWEIDPDQPRPDGVKGLSRFRHYNNLDKMEPRLKRLLSEFNWGRVDEAFALQSSSEGMRSAS